MSKINSARLQLLLRDVGYFVIGALIIIVLIGFAVVSFRFTRYSPLLAAFLCGMAYLLVRSVAKGG